MKISEYATSAFTGVCYLLGNVGSVTKKFLIQEPILTLLNAATASDARTAIGAMSNPLTTNGDLIVQSGGATNRLGVGSEGQVLKVVTGAPSWSDDLVGMSNPMTDAGDLIYGGVNGVPTKLPAGTDMYILTTRGYGNPPEWREAPSSGLTNPMTTHGDIIFGGVGGVPTRLPPAPDNSGHTLVSYGENYDPSWEPYFANPMTTTGDLIYGYNTNGLAMRLPIGTEGQVLTVSGGVPVWAAGGGDPVSWSSITGKPTFATVATSGSYSDLINKPTLATVATSGSYTDLIDKPSFSYGGFKNKIVDGNFDIWLEGATSSTNGYGAATMWSGIYAGSAMTRGRYTFALGQTAVPYEPVYFHRSVVTSSAGAGNYARVVQKIESVRTFAGQTCTISFWAKADTSKNIAIEFEQYFGSGGSPSAGVTTIGVSTFSLTNSWQKFTVTVTLPSISGKILGSNGDDLLQLNFWFDAGSNFNSRTNSLGQQSGTFDIAQVQLEAGSVATPFEVLTVGETMVRVGNYYEEINLNGHALIGTTSSTSTANTSVFWKYKKRSVPSVTLPSAGQTAGTVSFTTGALAYPATTGSHSTSGVTLDGFGISASGYSGLTANAACSLYSNGLTKIKVDARL